MLARSPPKKRDIINFPFIDYIVKAYSPKAQYDENKYRFVKMNLFVQSTTHPSMQIDGTLVPTYERPEYLGDSLYHMFASQYLYMRYDDQEKGFLTKLRIKLERGESMTELTKIMGLDKYILCKKTSLNDKILEDVFEAFCGAFYLNFGLTHSRTLIYSLLEKHKDFAMLIAVEDNYKDLLLQYFHKMKYSFPKYLERVDENNNYISTVRDPFGKVLGKGKSKTKIKAEQIASKNALIKVGIITDENVGLDWIERIESLGEVKIKKKKKEENKMSVFNPNNKLMKYLDIKEILETYNVAFPKGVKPNYKTFHEAMTHKSYLQRKKLTEEDKENMDGCVRLQKKSNERLQFFGDSVIHFIIAEYLYHTYPDRDEGFMTRLRCKLENAQSLFYLAKQIGIDEYILLSQNIDVLYNNRDNINIVGGGLEAFVGALYLELGMHTAREFVLQVIRIELDIDEIADNETNYKEIIAQMYIRNGWGNAKYKILKQTGPDHKTIFTMGLYFKGKLMTKGTANSKKAAEQIAAKKMYLSLQKHNVK